MQETQRHPFIPQPVIHEMARQLTAFDRLSDMANRGLREALDMGQLTVALTDDRLANDRFTEAYGFARGAAAALGNVSASQIRSAARDWVRP